MDFNVMLGSLSNKSLKMELVKVLRVLTDMYSKGAVDINGLRFYCFELHLNKIVKRTLLTLEVNDLEDLTILSYDELVKKLKINHECMEGFLGMDKSIILDETIYLDVVFKNSP